VRTSELMAMAMEKRRRKSYTSADENLATSENTF
jgi:hypothetical protein